MMKKSVITRRNFIGKSATFGLAGIAVPPIIAGCSREPKKRVTIPVMLEKAPDGPVLKAGLIGCGGRGTGAAIDFLNAGPNLQITALGDTFKDRLDMCRQKIKDQKGQVVPEENCFVGLDAYKKVIDSGVDIILTATPPFFRPQIFEAAVEAGKHTFLEKPVCVDPVGARQIMSTAKKAQSMELSVVTGTLRRRMRSCVATWQKVAEGAIGEIVSANCYYNVGKIWHREWNPDWSEMEYMIRDWINWCWLSGDHIVEQHIHDIDVINWFTGTHPVKALGFGSRLRRVTGNQFDNFSVDYTFENGTHFHSMCRQINGCANQRLQRIQGSKGSSDCNGTLWDLAGKELWSYPYPLDKDGKPDKTSVVLGGFQQEHIDLVTAIRTGKPINDAEGTAVSTLVAIMGRVSAYTGKEVTYEEMLNSDLKLGPEVLEFGPVNIPKEIPIPGEAWTGKG